METKSNHLVPGTYQHYKGNQYEGIGVAMHSETNEKLVVNRDLYGSKQLFVRPKKMFLEEVKSDKYTEPRFKPISQV
jgi:hypothetical protein